MSTAAPLRDSPSKIADPYGALSMPLAMGAGSLKGVVKDNIDVAGLSTTCGSARFASQEAATRNADVLKDLIKGDLQIVGRARMHELAFGVTGVNPWSGTPRNPRDAARIPGGSSSGCAVAVASGVADFAVGTDTGGSIRVPAACCGVIGLKTTNGLVSRRGIHPRMSSLDCVGILARDFPTLEAVMNAIAPGFRSAVLPDHGFVRVVSVKSDAKIAEAFRALLGGLSIKHVDAELTGLDEAFRAGLTIISAEMWREFSWLAPDFTGVGPDVAERLRRASKVSDGAEHEARLVGRSFARQVDELLDETAFLVLPTLPCEPPLLCNAEDPLSQLRLTELVRPFNVSGHPAISLPFDGHAHLPLSVQIIGRRGQDAELCAFAAHFHALLIQEVTATA